MRDIYIEQIERLLGLKFPDEQLHFITHMEAPANVISCAGSGKTTLMLAKQLYIQLKHNVNPSSICTLSFNRSAVEDIELRYNTLAVRFGFPTDRITFKTYHALYKMVIGYFNRDLKVGEPELISSLYNKAFYEVSKNKSDTYKDDILRMRGFAANNMLKTQKDLFGHPEFIITGINSEDYLAVIKKFNEHKQLEGVVDFDDLQIEMYKLLRENEKARELVQNAWDYWFVDEYQDISAIQFEILKLSIKDFNKLSGFGDEDQCINEFRGSKVDFVLDFPIFFPNTKRFIMNYNYRCPSNILTCAEKLIQNNTKRIEKNMHAFKQGGEISKKGYSSSIDAAMAIASNIRDEYISGRQLSEIAILYRNNSQQLFLIDQLIQASVPVRITRESNMIHNNIFIKDILKVIDLAIDFSNVYSFKEVFPRISKWINRKDVKEVADKMVMFGGSFLDYLPEKYISQNADVILKLTDIGKMVESKAMMSDIIDEILELYSGFVKFVSSGSRMSLEEASEVIDYIKFIAKDKSYKQFLFYIERSKSIITLSKTSKDGVVLGTMHGVKGLEYELVYIFDVSDYVIPSKNWLTKLMNNFGQSVVDDYIEQERRLMYVACTRAKEKLFISYVEGSASQFVSELKIDDLSMQIEKVG